MAAKIKTAVRSSGHRHPHKPKGVDIKAFNRVYWPYLPVILIIGLLMTLGVRQSGFYSAARHPGSSVLAYATSMQQQALLADTNNERARAHLGSLQLSSQLDQAAQNKAKDMAIRNYWSHNTPDGNPPWVFVADQNYAYQKLGENLAAGFDNEQAAINGWMASPTHKENLLDPSFTQVGFGVASSTNYTSAGGGPMTIVVAFYGSPAQSATGGLGEKPSTGTAAISTVKGDKSSNVSLAQLAVAKLSVARLATDFAVLLAAGAIGIWLGRHLLVLRKALAKGEKYVFSHPLLDLGLIIIAALSYLLTHTAGLTY